MSICLARKAYFSCGKSSDKSQFGFGYNYTLEVVLEGEKDPVSGLVVNLTDVDKELKKLVQTVDHIHLDQSASSPLDKPMSAEVLAQYFWTELAKTSLKPLLKKVNLTEGDELMVSVERSG